MSSSRKKSWPSLAYSVTATGPTGPRCFVGAGFGRGPPNKRLKLAGGDRFKGSGVLCAAAHEQSFNGTPPLAVGTPAFKGEPAGGGQRNYPTRGDESAVPTEINRNK